MWKFNKISLFIKILKIFAILAVYRYKMTTWKNTLIFYTNDFSFPFVVSLFIPHTCMYKQKKTGTIRTFHVVQLCKLKRLNINFLFTQKASSIGAQTMNMLKHKSFTNTARFVVFQNLDIGLYCHFFTNCC